MLYLAQVSQNTVSAELELELLAQQNAHDCWQICEPEFVNLERAAHSDLAAGLLVLVELNHEHQIIQRQPATEFVLGLLRTLEQGIAAEFLVQEAARLEEWRRTLTVQNLDLTRVRLEIEARREELQALEANLKREQEKLQRKTQSN
ncbi:MAG: hypothetical protein AAGG02_03105 [Cyanobacteria bacterium P01_H01_bin.15]